VDWRELEEERGSRRSSGRARGWRPQCLWFSLLGGAMEEEEWVDDLGEAGRGFI
jgi:hypothetical protein